MTSDPAEAAVSGEGDTRVGHLQLVYVDGCWAWFAEKPYDAWGDDWNDAPHDANAGDPYRDRGGRKLKVAYDGDLEIAGLQWGSYEPLTHGETPYGLSVQEINEGRLPWLYQPSHGLPQFPEPLLTIPALTHFVAFELLVKRAGGKVYR